MSNPNTVALRTTATASLGTKTTQQGDIKSFFTTKTSNLLHMDEKHSSADAVIRIEEAQLVLKPVQCTDFCLSYVCSEIIKSLKTSTTNVKQYPIEIGMILGRDSDIDERNGTTKIGIKNSKTEIPAKVLEVYSVAKNPFNSAPLESSLPTKFSSDTKQRYYTFIQDAQTACPTVKVKVTTDKTDCVHINRHRIETINGVLRHNNTTVPLSFGDKCKLVVGDVLSIVGVNKKTNKKLTFSYIVLPVSPSSSEIPFRVNQNPSSLGPTPCLKDAKNQDIIPPLKQSTSPLSPPKQHVQNSTHSDKANACPIVDMTNSSPTSPTPTTKRGNADLSKEPDYNSFGYKRQKRIQTRESLIRNGAGQKLLENNRLLHEFNNSEFAIKVQQSSLEFPKHCSLSLNDGVNQYIGSVNGDHDHFKPHSLDSSTEPTFFHNQLSSKGESEHSCKLQRGLYEKAFQRKSKVQKKIVVERALKLVLASVSDIDSEPSSTPAANNSDAWKSIESLGNSAAFPQPPSDAVSGNNNRALNDVLDSASDHGPLTAFIVDPMEIVDSASIPVVVQESKPTASSRIDTLEYEASVEQIESEPTAISAVTNKHQQGSKLVLRSEKLLSETFVEGNKYMNRALQLVENATSFIKESLSYNQSQLILNNGSDFLLSHSKLLVMFLTPGIQQLLSELFDGKFDGAVLKDQLTDTSLLSRLLKILWYPPCKTLGRRSNNCKTSEDIIEPLLDGILYMYIDAVPLIPTANGITRLEMTAFCKHPVIQDLLIDRINCIASLQRLLQVEAVMYAGGLPAQLALSPVLSQEQKLIESDFGLYLPECLDETTEQISMWMFTQPGIQLKTIFGYHPSAPFHNGSILIRLRVDIAILLAKSAIDRSSASFTELANRILEMNKIKSMSDHICVTHQANRDWIRSSFGPDSVNKIRESIPGILNCNLGHLKSLYSFLREKGVEISVIHRFCFTVKINNHGTVDQLKRLLGKYSVENVLSILEMPTIKTIVHQDALEDVLEFCSEDSSNFSLSSKMMLINTTNSTFVYRVRDWISRFTMLTSLLDETIILSVFRCPNSKCRNPFYKMSEATFMDFKFFMTRLLLDDQDKDRAYIFLKEGTVCKVCCSTPKGWILALEAYSLMTASVPEDNKIPIKYLINARILTELMQKIILDGNNNGTSGEVEHQDIYTNWLKSERMRVLEGKTYYSREEDQQLQKAVKENGRVWTEIAKKFPNRDRNSLMQRYDRLQSNPDNNDDGNDTKIEARSKVPFSLEEDQQLQKAVNENGRVWKQIAKKFPKRDGPTLQKRYEKLQSNPTMLGNDTNSQRL